MSRTLGSQIIGMLGEVNRTGPKGPVPFKSVLTGIFNGLAEQINEVTGPRS
jgi:hypothetical protein